MDNFKIFILFIVLLCGLLAGLYLGFYIQARCLPGRNKSKRKKKMKKKSHKKCESSLLEERAIKYDSYTNFLCDESGEEISKVVHQARKTQDGKYTRKNDFV